MPAGMSLVPVISFTLLDALIFGSPLETGPARSQDRFQISDTRRANTHTVREPIPNSIHTWEVGEGH